MKYLHDFIVIEEGGVVLFSHSKDSSYITDPSLFAGFLEAITIFFQMSLRDSMVDINGEKIRISFYSYNQLLFVGIGSKTSQKASCTKELKFLAHSFHQKFEDSFIESHQLDVLKYEIFRDELT